MQNSDAELGGRTRRQNSDAEFGGRIINVCGRSVGGWDVILDIIQGRSGTAYSPAGGSSNTEHKFWGFNASPGSISISSH